MGGGGAAAAPSYLDEGMDGKCPIRALQEEVLREPGGEGRAWTPAQMPCFANDGLWLGLGWGTLQPWYAGHPRFT